jgi:hypothetical protein
VKCVTQKQAELERAGAEIDRLRQPLKEAQRGGHQQNTKRKKKDKPKHPGRKPGKGPFARRAAPPSGPSTPPPEEVPVTVVRCLCCGGELKFERVDEVSNTDIPPQAVATRANVAQTWRNIVAIPYRDRSILNSDDQSPNARHSPCKSGCPARI